MAWACRNAKCFEIIGSRSVGLNIHLQSVFKSYISTISRSLKIYVCILVLPVLSLVFYASLGFFVFSIP